MANWMCVRDDGWYWSSERKGWVEGVKQATIFSNREMDFGAAFPRYGWEWKLVTAKATEAIDMGMVNELWARVETLEALVKKHEAANYQRLNDLWRAEAEHHRDIDGLKEWRDSVEQRWANFCKHVNEKFDALKAKRKPKPRPNM